MPYYYNKFSVFSVLSESESFGVVVLEAMACGCIVVCSDALGFVELVNPMTGIIVKKNDIEATYEALQYILNNNNNEKIIKMRKSAREHVVEKFNWDNNVAQMNSIYKKLLL